MAKPSFPRIAALGVNVVHAPIPHVSRDALQAALGERWPEFCELLGIQTQLPIGPHPQDVEAILTRMESGRPG